MAIAPDEFQLEAIAQAHPIAAALFVPFVRERLIRNDTSTEATLAVRLRDIDVPGEQQRKLRLWWLPATAPAQPLGVAETTVTEWAALGLACVVATVYGRMQIRAVTAQGDRFDYWLTRGEVDYGLEVSGTLTDEVEARHRVKVRQLRANPYGVDGFVVVAGFATREVIFSFHRFEETAS